MYTGVKSLFESMFWERCLQNVYAIAKSIFNGISSVWTASPPFTGIMILFCFFFPNIGAALLTLVCLLFVLVFIFTSLSAWF